MKNFSNKYIFLYSIVLVAVVAVLLSVVAMSLKSYQDANVRNEKMQTLLAAINVEAEAEEAADMYKQYFDQEMTINTKGEIVSIYDIKAEKMQQGDVRAFNIVLKNEQKLEKANAGSGAFPIYTFTLDGKKGYVIPTQGSGLWGAVYSNIALADDFNTVIGVTFSHDSETPGLGAEISTKKFQEPFIGKQILDENGQVISVSIIKRADPAAMHEVDAISGGTMTSNGVDAMLKDDLKRYQAFIDTQLSQTEKAPVEEVAEETIVENTNEEEVAQ